MSRSTRSSSERRVEGGTDASLLSRLAPVGSEQSRNLSREQIELRKLEYEAEALLIANEGELIANEKEKFGLCREKIYLGVGLLLVLLLVGATIGLYLGGDVIGACYLLGGGSGVGGMSIGVRRILAA